MEPTRELFWNAPGGWWFYALAVAPFAALGYGLYPRVRLWQKGAPDDRFHHWKARFVTLLADGLAQRRTLAERYPGLMHLFIFWGMMVLVAGTTIEAVYHILDIPFVQGMPYLALSLFVDISGLIVIAGILMAAYRRYWLRPDRLDSGWDDGVVLVWLLLVLVSGFLVEGLRMAVTETKLHPEWALWSPIGYAVALLLNSIDTGALRVWHALLWWGHLLLSMGFVAYISWSKLIHIFTASANILLRSLKPKGVLRPIPDLENAGHFGVSRIEHFTWKQLLDLDACTRCGRCQDACPAYQTKKPLSPKALVQDLKAAMEGRKPSGSLVGDTIKDDTVWACTTCRACQEHCPVYVEHVDKIVDLRRYLALEESRFPRELRPFFDHLEVNGNPWEIAWNTRGDWAKVESVPTLAEKGQAEWLYWAGCFASFDSRNTRLAASLCRLLRRGGIDFAILGNDEKCCGDPARRLGNEYLFQMLAQENIESLHSHGVRRIVTACPHCFNTLKNEYPQLGGHFEVWHDSQLLAMLVAEGRIKVSGEAVGRLTYHDPCYLGRYNGEFESPRRLLAALPGAEVVEMRHSRPRSFCCGAGGGRNWMEESTGQRINSLRVEQALATGAGTVAVACPYCLSMLEDGVRSSEADIKVAGIAELLDSHARY